MADEKIALDLEVRLEGAQTVEELKAVLKAARNEAVRFGEGTAEFDKFTKVAGKAKDQIGDLNDRIKALDPGSKVQAFAGLAQTIAGGFAAAQGAAALFGSENEDLQKAILKTQGAVALLQGIQAIADSKKQLGAVAAILGIKGQTAGTVALTVVQRIYNAVMKANPAVLILSAITAVIGALVLFARKGQSEADKALASFERLREARESQFSIQEGIIALNKAEGASAEEVYEATRKLIQAKGLLALTEAKAFQAKKLTKKLTEEETKQYDALITSILGYREAILKLDSDEGARNNKIKEQANADHKAKVDARNKLAEERAKEKADFAQQLFERDEFMQEQAEKRKEEEAKALQEQAEFNAERIEQLRLRDEVMQEMAATRAAEELANIKATEEAKYSLASSGVEGLLQLSNILMKEGKKAEGVRKGLALAQIGIDTAQAIGALVAYSNTAATASGPAAPFVAAAYYATGIVRILAGIAKAKQLLGKSGGGTDISPPSMGGGGGGRDVSRPPDIFAGSQRTLLDDAERRRGKQSAPVIIEAVVVETDMTDSQKGVAVANSRARRRVR